MTKRPESLQPGDIAVALRLVESPGATYAELAKALGISKSAAHRAVQRLERAKLLVPGQRRVMKHAFRNFLESGLRHVFFTEPGPEALGVPTAHSAPPLSQELNFDRFYVWPSAQGVVRGSTISPLIKNAPELPHREPNLYRALALVDALRVGTARERRHALELLDEFLERGEESLDQ